MNNNITRCPHCGNKTSHQILNEATTNEPFYNEDDEVVAYAEHYYYLVRCSTCEEVSLFYDWNLSENEIGVLENAVLLYPHQKKMGNEVPDIIKFTYSEAKKIKKISPALFTISIRKVLEMVCKDQNAIGKNLKEKIEYLSKNKIIPDTFKPIAEAIRFFGNENAHGVGIDTDGGQADILDDLLAVIIEYIYIAPAKIDKLRKSIKKVGSLKSSKL